MHTETIMVTPKLANEWLCHNTDNRPINWNLVDSYSDQMAAGQWKLSHQGVAFDTTGRLIDGQKRLLAIKQSNCAVAIRVTREQGADTFDVTDVGQPRSPADILRVSPKVSELCTAAYRYAITSERGKLTPAQVQRSFRAFGVLSEEIYRACTTNTRYFTSAPVRLAVMVAILEGGDRDYILNTYANLGRAKIDALPPIAAAWVGRRVVGDIPDVGQADIMARGLHVFTKKNAKLARMKRDMDTVVAIDRARAVLRPIWDKTK